jgi:hypothetical protein
MPFCRAYGSGHSASGSPDDRPVAPNGGIDSTNGKYNTNNDNYSTNDWSSWKQSMIYKNELDNIAQKEILRKELRQFLPKELHPTLATIHDLHLLNDLSYMYVMYGNGRPNIQPHSRVSVRRMTIPHIEAIESDASNGDVVKRDVITLLLWVMRDFGCL